MNWTINDTNSNDFRYITSPQNQNVIYFADGETTSNKYVGNYSRRITNVGNVSKGVVSFHLSNLTIEDAGRYSFKILGSIDVGGQVLVIAVSPKQPVVTEITPAVQGFVYRLKCLADSNTKPSNHGLPMKSEWKFRDQSSITGEHYTILGTELTIDRLTSQDNRETVICVAYEDNRAKSAASPIWIIDVKYGPENVLLTSSDHIIVTETSSLSINCTADCNPPCNFKWRRGSSVDSVSMSQTLDIKTASKNDADNYTCFVHNNVTMINKTISTTVIVNYGPSSNQMTLVPPEKSIKVEEHTAVSIICSNDCYPVCQYKWTGPLSLVIQSASLSLPMDRNKGGTYTCTAENEQNQRKTATTTVTITVYYDSASTISIGSIPPLYNVELNQTVADIVCDASCNPPCDFSWYKDATLFSDNKILSIGVVKKTDRANYTCKASNQFLDKERSSSKSFDMIVNYGAEVKYFLVQEGTAVNENGSATFLCSVDSHPKSTIMLKRQSNDTILKREVDILQSQYELQLASCLDVDNYTCYADNGVRQPVVTTIQFFVKCHPRTDSEVPLETKVYKKLHEAAFLRYEVISYPLPKFTWTFLGNGSESRDLPYSASLHVNGRQTELRFTSLNIDDFGYYSVVADNLLPPTDRKVFEIILSEPPSPVIRDFQVGAVVGGVVGGIALVIAIVAVVVGVKRRTLRPKMEENIKREAHGSRGPEYINTAFRNDINTTEYEALQSGQTGASQYEALNDPKSKLNQSTDIRISSDPRPSTDEMFYDKLQPCDTNQGHMYSCLSSPRLDDGEKKFYENAVMSTK